MSDWVRFMDLWFECTSLPITTGCVTVLTSTRCVRLKGLGQFKRYLKATKIDWGLRRKSHSQLQFLYTTTCNLIEALCTWAERGGSKAVFGRFIGKAFLHFSGKYPQIINQYLHPANQAALLQLCNNHNCTMV